MSGRGAGRGVRPPGSGLWGRGDHQRDEGECGAPSPSVLSLDPDPHSTPRVWKRENEPLGAKEHSTLDGPGGDTGWEAFIAGLSAAEARPGPFPGNSWLCREQPVVRN